MCTQWNPQEETTSQLSHGTKGRMDAALEKGGESQGEEVPQETADSQRELAGLRERYLRLAADFDNFKKRMAREHDRRAAAQKEGFVRELLPVIDNLERALAGGTCQSAEQLKLGVQMTLQQVFQLLRQHGFEPQEDLGKAFDPHRHEAVAVRAEPKHPDHAVLEVWQRGWGQGTSLFRPAKVVVNDVQAKSGSGPGAAREP